MAARPYIDVMECGLGYCSDCGSEVDSIVDSGNVLEDEARWGNGPLIRYLKVCPNADCGVDFGGRVRVPGYESFWMREEFAKIK